MRPVEVIADTNIVSYAFRGDPLGDAYMDLIGDRRIGITGMCLAELRMGSIIGGWDDRKTAELISFIERFTHVCELEGVAEVCGGIRGHRHRVGRPIDLPDAWVAACALWLDVPLVTHDRDLEGIPGLRVLTLHNPWRVGEESLFGSGSSGLQLDGDSRALC
jgi:predicted nucleic acid-binding protein